MTSYRSGGGMTAHAIDGAYHTGSLAHASTSGKTATDHHSNANDPAAGEKTHLTAITTEGVTHPFPAYRNMQQQQWRASSVAPEDAHTYTAAGGTSTTAIEGKWWVFDLNSGGTGIAYYFFGSSRNSGQNSGGPYMADYGAELVFCVKLADVADADDLYYMGLASYDGANYDGISMALEPGTDTEWQLRIQKQGNPIIHVDTGVTGQSASYLWWKIVCSSTAINAYSSTDGETWTYRCKYDAVAANIPTGVGMCPYLCVICSPGAGAARAYVPQVAVRQTV